MIDDYEEEIIDNIKISKLIEVVSRFKKQTTLEPQEASVVTARRNY